MSVVIFVLVLQVGSTYTNDWGVRIDAGIDVADAIAAKHGFINIGQVCFLLPETKPPAHMHAAVYPLDWFSSGLLPL